MVNNEKYGDYFQQISQKLLSVNFLLSIRAQLFILTANSLFEPICLNSITINGVNTR